MFPKGLKRGPGNRIRPFSRLKFLILKCVEICCTLAQDVLPQAKQCFIDGHAILLLSAESHICFSGFGMCKIMNDKYKSAFYVCKKKNRNWNLFYTYAYTLIHTYTHPFMLKQILRKQNSNKKKYCVVIFIIQDCISDTLGESSHFLSTDKAQYS